MGPVKEKGTYYFYYLPYQVQLGHGGYSGGYIPQEKASEANWLVKVNAISKLLPALITSVQSRTAFDSFYPMELIATTQERTNYLQKHKADWYLFAEDRKNPIRMQNHLPMKWISDLPGKEFKAEAVPNEYYAFQIGVWAGQRALQKLTYKASALRSTSATIPASAITCFNVEGTDPYGATFKKELNVSIGQVQVLWFGIDIPQRQKAGTYKGSITISDATGQERTVPISIQIVGAPLADRGDSEPWKHSRLRWLNSTLGIADTPTSPYTAMTVDENRINCLGRTISVEETTGLPTQIEALGNALLENPIRFVIQTTSRNATVR